MHAFCDWMDGQSRLLKIIFCLPILDILWGVYRLGGAIANKDVLHIVLAVLWIIFGGWIGWILDLVFILITGRICWFKE